MKHRFSILGRHAGVPKARSKPGRPGTSRIAVALALSGAAASTALLLAYRRRKHESDAARLEGAAGPTLLDKVLPLYEFRDSIWVHVKAAPREIFRAFDVVTLADMPLAWLLGTLRYLPATLSGKMKPTLPDSEPFGKQFMGPGSATLARVPDREVVIGTIGKFHQLRDQAMLPLTGAEEFASFADPAYQKLAMSIRVEPGVLFGEYKLILEHRTHALSEESRRQFARYWLAIKPGGAFVSKLLLNAVKRRAERYAAEQSRLTQVPAEGAAVTAL
jgi:hypothetical protein